MVLLNRRQPRSAEFQPFSQHTSTILSARLSAGHSCRYHVRVPIRVAQQAVEACLSGETGADVVERMMHIGTVLVEASGWNWLFVSGWPHQRELLCDARICVEVCLLHLSNARASKA